MRHLTTAVACVATTCSLGAQEQADKPYQEGGVHEFLERARANDRPSIVLFNFDLESG